jgi:Mg-chelatase subunit ChlD
MDDPINHETTPSVSRLKAVKSIFISFLSGLRKKSQHYTVSLISFAARAHILMQPTNISLALQNIPSDWAAVHREKTYYLPAVSAADVVITSRKSSVTAGVQAVFFLSDGVPFKEDEDKVLKGVKRLVKEHNATLSTCLFGCCNHDEGKIMRKMAISGRGQFHLASGVEELNRALQKFEALI